MHVVPHSHDDVGWKKTNKSEESNGNQTAAVRKIIMSIVDELLKDKNKTYS